MRRRSLLTLSLVSTTGLLTACGSDPLAPSDGPTGSTTTSGAVTIGSANFPESELLAEMYAQVLEAAGISVTRKFSIGSREVYLRALQDGSVDLVPEYNGALLSYLSQDETVDADDRDAVRTALEDRLPDGLELLTEAEAQDKDSLVVTAETAQRLTLASIPDLAPVSGDLVLGAGAEYAERQQGLLGLKDVYGVTFKEFRPLDAGGALTVGALSDGTIKVASLLSTDPVISENGFVVLTDPENLFGVQNVVPLISTTKNSPEISSALDGFSSTLTTENLTAAVGRITVDHESTADAATAYLQDNHLL